MSSKEQWNENRRLRRKEAQERERREGVGSKRRSGQADPLVVRTECLAQILDRWEVEFLADHPQNYSEVEVGVGTGDGVTGSISRLQVGPHMHLSMRMQISMSEESKLRALQRIKRRESRHTTLAVADAVLTAMGFQISMFEDLTPVPNPRWSREKWEAWRAEHGGCASD